MSLYTLRLLIALLTFAVGVAAAWLFNFETPRRSECRAVSRVVLAPAAPPQEGMQRRQACPFDKTPLVEGGILNGKAISKPQPAYPPDAKAAHVGGTVAVRVLLDEGGLVTSATAISGPELLRDAAEEAAREVRFSPTRLSGQPARVSGVITYNFVPQ